MSQSLIRHRVHVETFPDRREITTELVDDVKDLLTFAYAGMVTRSLWV